MKRILLLLVFTLTLLTSCKKILDLQATDSLTPIQSYTNTTQIKAAVNGIYSFLRGNGMYAKFYTQWMTIATDESYFYNQSAPYTYYNNISTDPDIANVWIACYQGINNANSLLDNIDSSSAGKVDAGVVRRAKGEALFLRSYYYFLLAQWWGDVPLQLHTIQTPEEGQIARTPVKQVYDQIIADMATADSMLYDQTPSTFTYSERVTNTVVEGMLARVCLFAAGYYQANQTFFDTKRYADAAYWALKVKNAGYNYLLPSYAQVFVDEGQNKYNKETMWEVGYNQSGVQGAITSSGTIGVYFGIGQTANTDSGYCYGYGKMHPRLYFTYENGDYRREWNCANFTYANAVKTPLANNIYWLRQPAKWRRENETPGSRATQNSSSVNFPLLRYSDVLLMLAEAENENPANAAPTQLAYNAINEVRERSMSDTPIADSILLANGGSGYTNFTPIRFTAPNGFAYKASFNGGKVSSVLLESAGAGFPASNRQAIYVGISWVASTFYQRGTQIVNPANKLLYTVTTAGTTTLVPPTNTSGSSSAATTGAVFTYAGNAATVYVYPSGQPQVDLQPGLSKEVFRQKVREERMRELCYEALRLQDLKRWGILIPTIKSLALDIAGKNTTDPRYARIPAANLSRELKVNGDATPLYPVLSISDKDWFWPIPINDLLYNKKMTQNPGY
ncbi:RagB/SusD family nutrient uptake outer membrane protein [Parasediminibacterium sp. JCM 36343]|uniref:RagB/SusD family nutrient uptake outer membrane protein n=1 Tax=Parasediminibacterium sp. JCM 36343 TaxID=3374279 RepID=UPI003978C31E